MEEGRIRPVTVSRKKRDEFDGSTPWKTTHKHKKYMYRAYWEDVGQSLIREALAAGGFWASVFDPDAASRDWRAAPDELAIAYLLPEALHGRS